MVSLNNNPWGIANCDDFESDLMNMYKFNPDYQRYLYHKVERTRIARREIWMPIHIETKYWAQLYRPEDTYLWIPNNNHKKTMITFKEGDIVEISWYTWEYTIDRIDSSDDARFKDKIWHVNVRDLTLIKKKYSKHKDIWWYECLVTTVWDKLIVQFRDYKYETTYFWQLNDFLDLNTTVIAWYFATKVDVEVKAIMREFTRNFDNTIVKLKEVVLPHTKDMLLAEVIDVFKKNITKVAKLFSDTSIKNTLLSLFK